MLTLYYSPRTCALAPHIVLEEIGAPYHLELVEAGPGTQSPEWRKVNPKGRVPALSPVPGSIGGTPDLLTEAVAIMVYLARRHPQCQLLSEDPVVLARTLEWCTWLATLHAGTFATMTRPYRFVEDEALYPALGAKGAKSMAENYAYIDRLLGDGRIYAADSSYSIADIYLMVFWVWGNGARLNFDMRRDYPNWARHADRLLARPAVRRVLEHEQVTKM